MKSPRPIPAVKSIEGAPSPDPKAAAELRVLYFKQELSRKFNLEVCGVCQGLTQPLDQLVADAIASVLADDPGLHAIRMCVCPPPQPEKVAPPKRQPKVFVHVPQRKRKKVMRKKRKKVMRAKA